MMAANRESGGPTARPDARARRVYLQPGQFFASAEACLVTTILGSCVAVCLWDETTGIGGLNHFLLPHWAGGGNASPRFGNVAAQELLDAVLGLGARRQALRAKVFGGACVVEAFRALGQPLGSKNVIVARELLERARIPVVASDVGGRHGRKLLLDTASGQAWVQLLNADGARS